MGDAEINKEGAVSNIGLVKRLSPNLIVAFDADLAGKKATLRACNIALSLGMDVKVASIVGGKDPADIILENPDSWKEVLKSSKHVVEFELNNVVKEIEDKRKLNKAIFDRVLPLLARVDGASNQDFFVKMISDKSGISTDALWQDLRTVRDRLAKEGGANTQGQEGNGNIKSSIYNKHNRLDIIERQVFGVLFSMEVNNVADIDKYKEELKRILDSEYEDRYSNALKEKDDLLFEVLGYFGDDVKRLSVHMKELLKNLEIDMINDQLAKYMHELKIAESKKDDGKMLELAKKCQELTVRKAKLK
jgi:DNA primase